MLYTPSISNLFFMVENLLHVALTDVGPRTVATGEAKPSGAAWRRETMDINTNIEFVITGVYKAYKIL